MKNYIVLDGKKIPLSEETVKNLSKSLKEKRYLMADPNKDIFGIMASGGTIQNYGTLCDYKLQANESHNRRTLEKALKFIQLQNFADEVNEEFDGADQYFIYLSDWEISIGRTFADMGDGGVYFSSTEAAQKAIDYFGEEWIKDYMK